MSIIKPTVFDLDSNNKINYIIPLVIIYKGVRADSFDDLDNAPAESRLFLSTQNIFFDKQYYEPLLNKVPTIKHTIDTENRKFRIKTSALEIINTNFHGRIFSDNVKDIINCGVRIYYKSQSANTLRDCMLIGQTSIKRYEQSKDILKLDMEDISESILKKEIPNIVTHPTYHPEDRYKPYPMVYGSVEKSPVLRKLSSDRYDKKGDPIVTSLILDQRDVYGLFNPQHTIPYPAVLNDWYLESPIFIKDGDNYLNLISSLPDNLSSQYPGITDDTFYEFNENRVSLTDNFFNFSEDLASTFSNSLLTYATLSRVLRRFTNIKGQKCSNRQYVRDAYGDDLDWYFQSLHYCTKYNTENQLWDDSKTFPYWDQVPYWHFWDMWQIDGHYYQWETAFLCQDDPKDTQAQGNYDFYDWSGWTRGQERITDMMESWAIPHADGVSDSVWTIRPKDYLHYIYHDDEYGLGWSGTGIHDSGDRGDTWVYYEFELEPFSGGNYCFTYLVSEIIHWLNKDLTYSYFDDDADGRYLGGSYIWSNNASAVPNPVFTPNDSFSESWSTLTGSYSPSEKDQWNKWNHFPTVIDPPQENRIVTVPNYRRHVTTSNGEHCTEWTSPSQISSIYVGRPNYNTSTGYNDDAIMYNTGMINYMHFIQDIVIEDPINKPWFVNTNGRTGYSGSLQIVPFNTFIVNYMPTEIFEGSDDDIITWLVSEGYNTNTGSGGWSGWLINAYQDTDTSQIQNQFNVMPQNMLFKKFDDSSLYKYNGVGFNGDDAVDWSAGTAGIFFTDRLDIIFQHSIDPVFRFARAWWIEGLSEWSPMDISEIVDYVNGLAFSDSKPLLEPDKFLENPTDIIKDIMINETRYRIEDLNYDSFIKSYLAHQNWKMSFVIDDLMPIKTLIQELCSNTKIYPIYGSDGNFTFATLGSIYNADDVNSQIIKNDIIDYKFSMSKIEDVRGLQGLNYDYDKALKRFNRVILPDEIETVGAGKFINLSFIQQSLYGATPPVNWNTNMSEIYNINDLEEKSTFDSKYIRDRYTAGKLREYLLFDNMNQHLLIDMTLPNKYIHLDLGDIIYVEQLSDELGLGQKYWAYEAKNGQLLYPFFIIIDINKKSNRVHIKLRRLHRLQYGMPLWLIAAVQTPNPQYGATDYPDNFETISQVYDDGGIYDKNQANVTYIYEPPSDYNYTNDEFEFHWLNDNNLLGSEGNYEVDETESNDLANGNIIRVDIKQNPLDGDPQDYRYAMRDFASPEWDEDDLDGAVSSTYFQTWNAIQFENKDAYVLIYPKEDNTGLTIRQGQLKIIADSGEEYVTHFFQNVTEEQIEPNLGDINDDGAINILDILRLVMFILDVEVPTDDERSRADMNVDGALNILDVALLINLILED